MQKIVTLRIGRPVGNSGNLSVQSIKVAFERLDVLRFLFGRKTGVSLFILDDYFKQIIEEAANEPHEATA